MGHAPCKTRMEKAQDIFHLDAIEKLKKIIWNKKVIIKMPSSLQFRINQTNPASIIWICKKDNSLKLPIKPDWIGR